MRLVYPIEFKTWMPVLYKWSRRPEVKRDILGDKTLAQGLVDLLESNAVFLGIEAQGEPIGFAVLTPDGMGKAEATIYAPGFERKILPAIADFAFKNGIPSIYAKFALDRLKEAPFPKFMEKLERMARFLGWQFEGVLKMHDTGRYIGLVGKYEAKDG